MANGTVGVQILEEIEYKVIGNAFGVLVAAGGLLAGNMVNQRSFEYWQEDIVLILLLVIMSFNLMRSFVTVMTAYQVLPPHQPAAPRRENVQPDQAAIAQISAPAAAPPKYTAEQVLDEVAKRIEAQKAEAAKKNKMVN